MRRVTWSVLTGLGAFFIVLALLLRFFLPGQAVKFPLNEYATASLRGTGVSYFSTAQLKVLSGVNVQAIETVKGNVAAANAAGGSNIAVWEGFLVVRDVTNNAPVLESYESLAFDRRTGQLVNCCGNVVGKNRNLHVSGQGFVFPVNTQQQDYQGFDTTLLKPELFRYAGTDSVDGVSTYKFVEQVNNKQVGALTVPGSLVSMTASSVTLPEFYSVTKTEWIDPVTGVPVNVDETETNTLQDSTGATRLLLFQGELKSTPQGIAKGVATDKSKADEIRLVEVTGPITLGALGIVLLAAGLVLGLRRREEDELREEDVEPVGSPS